MASCFGFVSFLIVSTLLFINQLVLCDQFTQNAIDIICSQTEDYDFCFKTFNQNLKSPSTDSEGLTQITIQQSLRNASNSYDVIEGILRNLQYPSKFKSALTLCQEAYLLARQYLQEANKYFQKKDYVGMMQSETVSQIDLQNCIDVFANPPMHPVEPIKTINTQMKILISMALVTAHQFPIE